MSYVYILSASIHLFFTAFSVLNCSEFSMPLTSNDFPFRFIGSKFVITIIGFLLVKADMVPSILTWSYPDLINSFSFPV